MNQLDGAIGTWLAVTGRDVLGREAYELGIASHYVAEESVPELAARLAQLAADKEVTPEEISAIVAEYHVPASRGPVSRSNPDGRSLISGDVRAFLDATFSLPSLSAIYAALSAAEADTSGHSAEVREWAREQRAIMDTRGPTGMAVAVENYALARAAKRFATTLELDIVMGTCFAGSNRASEDLLVGAVHALFEKHKTPIPFSPPITDLGNAFLRPEAIRRTFLTRESPHAHDSPPMDVGGGLVPLPTGVSADALWGKFRKFGIPSEDMVREVVESGASAEKVVQKLVKNERRARRDEFEAAVRRILTDHTKTVDGGLRQVA
jgi:3-hydroxyisobutyryl-CoA hydrolase